MSGLPGGPLAVSRENTLSIVIPVRNEQDNILPLTEEIHSAMEGMPHYELCIVDDHSTDRTQGMIANACARKDGIVPLALRPDLCGMDAAMALGMSFAKGNIIITMDGDRQNVPADIPALLDRRRLVFVDTRPIVVRCGLPQRMEAQQGLPSAPMYSSIRYVPAPRGS